mgnify:CR=1 FL=1
MLREKKKASELAKVIKIFPQVLINAKVNSDKKYDFDKNSEIQNSIKELEAEFPGYQVQRVDELSLSVACHIGDGCLAVACSRVVEV